MYIINGETKMEEVNKFKNRIPEKGMKWSTAELKEIFKFPIIGYRKENGFLGIISKDRGKIHFFSKSTDEGPYVNWFIGVLCENYEIIEKYPQNRIGNLITYSEIYNAMNQCQMEGDKVVYQNHLSVLKIDLIDKLNPLLEEGYSYVFECVDTVNDPHIIKYKENKVVLLEVFKNQLKEEHVSWKELHEIADKLLVPCKSQELRFNNWEEFEEWKDKFRQGVTQWDCKHEGYVFEDQNGYRVKFKSSFYQFWKQMRALKDVLAGGGTNKKVYKTKEEIQVVKLMEELGRDKLKEMSIIDVEDIFYERYGE